jgi:DNA-directed RNA polymerase sigma subunit (sigma70/sigma32)
MSKTTAALEAAVAEVITNRAADGARQTPRQRGATDRAFAAVLKLIAPRIRHFIRHYGLAHHWDDAEQACAIGVHRAIEAYDPTRAQFTTFVNWHLRGELQSLRFRLMTDQRPSARKVEATTVSMNALSARDGEETSLEQMIEDEGALSRTEAGASNYLAGRAREALVDQYVQHLRTAGLEQLKKRARARRTKVEDAGSDLPCFRAGAVVDPADIAELEASIAQHRAVIAQRLFADGTGEEAEIGGATRERVRQITKRATKTIAELTTTDPRFAVMAESGRPAAPRRARAEVAAL